MADITHIVVHYSATFPEQDVTAAIIDGWHKKRGFKKIGYHYFYRRNGMEEVGRKEWETGAHVKGKNTGKIGLCFSGGLDKRTGPNVGVNNMTKEQEQALVSRIKTLKKKWPKAVVLGHRDLGQTQCPGFDVASWWKKHENQ